VKLTLDSLGEAFRSYYDRLIAFLAIVALLVSLILLIMQLGGIKADERRFQDWEQGLTPAYAHATNVTLDVFDQAHNSLTNPFQITAWAKNLSIPELRISCLSCARPVPYNATECPFCKAPVVPGDKNPDKDEDGMDDEWEEKYGLNPLDPGDAKSDLDKDGFSNLEEFRFNPQTKPNDLKDSPPWIAKLAFSKVEAKSFHLKFMAVNKMTSGNIFQINSTKSGKTSWYNMGDTVEGFTIMDYKPIFVQEASTATGSKEVDRSTLTLESKATKRQILLVKGSADPISEFEVTFVFAIDGSTFTVKHGSDFTLRGSVFTVKEIDNNKNLVLIREQNTGKETWISRQEETP
jgi:hypothetical protein